MTLNTNILYNSLLKYLKNQKKYFIDIIYLFKKFHDFFEIFEVNCENAQIFEVLFRSIISHLIKIKIS